jgi:hypothetical protein
MRRQIDHHGAIAMTPPPGPLVDADDLEGWDVWCQGRPHQSEEGGRTGREPQAGGESGARVPSQSDADGLQGRDQSTGLPSIRGDEVRQALREDAAHTGRMAAHELPYHQLNTNGERAPGEVGEVALVAGYGWKTRAPHSPGSTQRVPWP